MKTWLVPLRGGLDTHLPEAQGSVCYKSSLWVVMSPEDADALSPDPTGSNGKLTCEAPSGQDDVVLEVRGGLSCVLTRDKRGIWIQTTRKHV